MAKVGDIRTRTRYTEATDLATIGSLTASGVIYGLSILGVAVTGLSPKSGFVVQIINILSGKKLSNYKVKFVFKEKYTYSRVFDTDQWINAYMWSLIDMKVTLIRK